MARARTTGLSQWVLLCLFVWAAFVVGLAPKEARASNVQFVGNVEYSYIGNAAVLTADRVQNFDSFGYSGTLHLELWAFPNPFTGSFQLGYKLAQYSLGQLTAGYYFYNINSGSILFLPPPNGVWYFALVVTEYTGGFTDGGYDARDWVNFPTPVTFGPPPPPPGQLQMPASVVFPTQQVGTPSQSVTITITNIGGSAVSVSSVNASDISEFPGATDCVRTIAAGGSCQITVYFQPTAVGLRSETMTITSNGVGSPQTISVSGTGSMVAPPPPPPPAGTVIAVEYYYAAWNFYFETAFPDEIAALDGGAFGGVWQRTGQTFNAWPLPANLTAVPTCRFFSTIFDPKSSHFYTPSASECASLKTGTAWQYEGIAFYIQLADANGLCAAETVPLYRAYNNGMGGAPNHRYTTSLTVLNQMLAAGWLFEGNGNTKVFACVPQ